MNNKYYFAYGSNLNQEKLLSSPLGFKPDDLSPVCKAHLPDYDLRFTLKSPLLNGGVLDIVKTSGSAVAGVVFEIKDEAAWDKLDKKEGRSYGVYKRFDATVVKPDGAYLNVLTYEVINKQDFVVPNQEYFKIVEQGLKSHGLSLTALEKAAKGEYPTSKLEDLNI